MSGLEPHRCEANWQSNVISAVQSLGYRNLTELLNSMPCQPYDLINARLGNKFAAIQLISVQYSEARLAGTTRDAAIDALCRHINEQMPNGWRHGKEFEDRRVSALANWASELRITGQCDKYEDVIHKIQDELNPPEGWLPITPNDSIIKSAFDLQTSIGLADKCGRQVIGRQKVEATYDREDEKKTKEDSHP